jgi:hypothetical protein
MQTISSIIINIVKTYNYAIIILTTDTWEIV